MKKLKITLTLMFSFITCISFSQTGITVNADAKLGIYGDVIINITDGDFINNSTENQFGGTIVFNGTSNQQISGTSESEFLILELDNSNGLTLGNNVRITNDLILNQGVFDIQDYDLTFLENSVISGTFSSGNMINAEGTGFVIREINTNGVYFFPVGDLTSGADYSPVELDFLSGTYAGGSVSVNLSNNKHPNNSSSGDYLNRYWTVNSTGITGFSCDTEFNYVNGDIVGNEADIFGGLWNGSNWVQLNQASGLQFTGNVVDFGDFTGAEEGLFNDIYELESDQFLLSYSNGTIFLFSPKDIHLSHAELYNSIGQLVNISDLNAIGLNEIHYSGSSGYYLIKIFTKESCLTKKIIIN